MLAECVLYIVQRPADEFSQTAVVVAGGKRKKKVFWPENFHEINLKKALIWNEKG